MPYTRNGFDWSERYPGIVSAAGELRCRAAILDGEVIVQDERGVSDFEALSAAIRWLPHTLRFYAFDILHLNGEDLRDQPLLDRRTKLKGLLGRDRTSPLQFSDEFTGDSAAFFRACTKHGLEGVVSKLASSRYRSGRSKTWLKSKCFTESDLVIIGTDRDRKTGATRALLANADLTYATLSLGRLGVFPQAKPQSVRQSIIRLVKADFRNRLDEGLVALRFGGQLVPRLSHLGEELPRLRLPRSLRQCQASGCIQTALARISWHIASNPRFAQMWEGARWFAIRPRLAI